MTPPRRTPDTILALVIMVRLVGSLLHCCGFFDAPLLDLRLVCRSSLPWCLPLSYVSCGLGESAGTCCRRTNGRVSPPLLLASLPRWELLRSFGGTQFLSLLLPPRVAWTWIRQLVLPLLPPSWYHWCFGLRLSLTRDRD